MTLRRCAFLALVVQDEYLVGMQTPLSIGIPHTYHGITRAIQFSGARYVPRPLTGERARVRGLLGVVDDPHPSPLPSMSSCRSPSTVR
jgi:hypothetical protein